MRRKFVVGFPAYMQQIKFLFISSPFSLTTKELVPLQKSRVLSQLLC